MKKKHFLWGNVFAAVFGLSSLAGAQSTKCLWIAGGARVLNIQRSTSSFPNIPNLPDRTTTTTYFGLAGSNVGIGYQFGEHFLFGGRFGWQVVSPEDSDSFYNGFAALHFQVPFLTGKVRPFIFAEPGLIVTRVTAPFPGQSRSETGFDGKLGGGAHLFVTDSFSISPYGSLGYQDIPDLYYSTVSFEIGALLSGWVWR